MKKFLILLVFAFAFPLFSQNVEPTDSAMSQIWDSMSEEEKSALLKEFLSSELQLEIAEDKAMREAGERYSTGKRRLRRGIILTSVGCGVGLTPFLFGPYPYFALVGVFGFWQASGGLMFSGIPILISGAVLKHKYEKYKPTVALAPNGIKFSMEF